MGMVAYGGIYAFEPFVNTETTIGIMLQSGASLFVALLAFLLCANSLELAPAQKAMGYIRRFFGR